MKNFVGLYCGLFRAIEIAKTGGYSISIHYDSNYENGYKDYKTIKNFCKGWFDNFVNDGDIKYEITRPPSYNRNGKMEGISDISARIKKSQKFPKPDLNISSDSESLLHTAYQRLDISISQVDKIKNIAATIAQMESSDKIQTAHIAESIQYSYIYSETSISAETEIGKEVINGNTIEYWRGLAEIDYEKTPKSVLDYISALHGYIQDVGAVRNIGVV